MGSRLAARQEPRQKAWFGGHLSRGCRDFLLVQAAMGIGAVSLWAVVLLVLLGALHCAEGAGNYRRVGDGLISIEKGG